MSDRASGRRDQRSDEAAAQVHEATPVPGKISGVERAYGSTIQRQIQRQPGLGYGGDRDGGGMGGWWMNDSMLSAMGIGDTPIQRKPAGASAGAGEGASAAEVADVGARGVGGAVSAMPYAETIQRSFGRHDIGGISAHLDGEAAMASRTLGAEAYASGNHVAFAGAPSLHTAAHEAAHVIQQRSGLSFLGGMGEAGDSHEQHADAVADAVVAGRSAEGLLDRYAPQGFSSSTGAVQRKPVKDGDDERHYHDDQHPRLRLVKEKGSEENEYRIKDRVQSVFWKEAGDLYFIDVLMKQPLDLDRFEATREFGSFLETFQESSKMESDKEEGSEGASMHLLQQFYSNALFNTSEVERFDYQASPLNYQVEHSYIRAAATSNVDVMKDQLLGDDFGLEKDKDKDKVFLSSQMDFGDTLHQMFRAVVMSQDFDENELALKLEPLALGLSKFVVTRFDKKTEFANENKLEKEDLTKQHTQGKKEIQRIQEALKQLKKNPQGDDVGLLEWIGQKDSYLKDQKDLDNHRKKAKPNFNENQQVEKLSNAAEGMGIKDKSLDSLDATKAGARLEAMQLDKAKGLDTPYAKKLVELDTAQRQLEQLVLQIQGVDRRQFDLMRGFDKDFGGLGFVDFSAALVGLAPKEAMQRVKAFGAKANEILEQLVTQKLLDANIDGTKVKSIMEELKKSKGMDKAFFSGGMVLVEDKGKELGSPALMVDGTTLAMPIKTALGKSGYVPTPTSVNRQLVQSKVPLKTIALAIIDKQLKRQPIDKETKQKLEAVKKELEAFDPSKYESVGGDRSEQLQSTKSTYEQFCKLSAHEDEHVGLLVRPVIKLYAGIGIFSEKSKLPAFALRQLETHLLDAIADAEDIVALQRSVQNLHELAIYALELSDEKPKDPSTLSLPDGAMTPHVTHYGLNAFSHAFEGVLKQNKENGKDELEIAALNNIYFEMMQKLGYTQGASGGSLKLAQPSSAEELVKNLPSSSSSSVKVAGPDLIVLDIHPNDAAKKEIHRNEVVTLLHQLFSSAEKGFRCTVLVDVTLNHISEDEIWNIRNEAAPYIESGQLNLVFNQSLTKFAQFGTDKHSGGLMFHYNNGKDWEAFNEHVEKCAKEDAVDPTIQKYFMALFEHTQKENLEYLEKVRRNSRYVYEKLQEQFSTISCTEAITLAENDDPETCYVAFNYEIFAAKVLGVDAPDTEVQQMAHDILYECINQLAGNLKLPLNMRTSFGFPISNLGDIDPGIRLTVGIESSELMDRYVQLLTFTNGALGREFDNNGDKNLKDPDKRKQFLSEITESVKQLSDLDKQVKELQEGKGAKQTSVPMSKKKSAPKPQTSTALGGEKIDVGMGSVEHVQNSCYIASLLNLFAASPAYRKLLSDNLPPKPIDDEVVVPTMEQELSQKLHEAILELRKDDGHVTGEMVESIRTTMDLMGFLQAPDDGGSKKSGSKGSVEDSGSKKWVTSQQDAAEILQKILGALTVPSSMKVGEQSRKKQGQDLDYSDHNEVVGEGIIQLPISARDIDTLDKALKRYCAEEDVEDFGMKLTTFKQMPSTLTFALKRFDFDGYGAKKNYRRLQVPLKFTMPQECLHPDLRGGESYEYQVVSCVEHKGGYGGGHYIAHGKTEDGKTYGNDDLQDGPRKESEQEFEDSLARSYLYVFQRVENL